MSEHTLDDVRQLARQKMKGYCGVYPHCDGSPNRMCMTQTYGKPINMGAVGKGLAFQNNVLALDAIRLKQRIISEHVEPDLGTKFLGRDIAFPMMASSMSGVKASMGGAISEEEFATAILQGSKDAGTIGWIGNTPLDGHELTGVNTVGKVGIGIPIMKPQSNERLLEILKIVETTGAIAVGMDLDGCGSTIWERMGRPVYRKTVSDIRELVDSTSLPFVVKSVMSVEDAEAAVDAGAAAIDVSNHGGRVLDSTRGVAEVLPDVVSAVGKKVPVTAGGGVRTGFDVFKMMALGASGVLIGRDLIRSAIGGGADGVRLHFNYLRNDFRRAMLLTSVNRIEDIDARVIDG